MPSGSIVADIAEGRRRAELNFTKDQILDYIKKIRAGKSAIFNELSSALQSVKIQRESAEWKLYRLYVKDKRLRKLVNYGLQVRLADKNINRREFLEGKVKKKYGLSGWHVSEFVANRILSKFINSVMDVKKNVEQLTLEVEQILNNIERDVTFIHSDTNIKEVSEALVSKLNQLSPNLHILTSKGSAANRCKNILENVKPIIKNYTPDEYTEGDEFVVFFKKIPSSSPMYP